MDDTDLLVGYFKAGLIVYRRNAETKKEAMAEKATWDYESGE
jgi:hypothetical protein